MKTDNAKAAQASREWQAERIAKRLKRKASKQGMVVHNEKQKRKAELRKREYIPRIKARLSDYLPGPVTVHLQDGTSRVLADPMSDEFLRSFEWRKVRMEAIKAYGNRCQCCGASPSMGAIINVDHIKPRRLFPALALTLSNLQILCADCNHGKGNWDMTDWRESRTTKD